MQPVVAHCYNTDPARLLTQTLQGTYTPPEYDDDVPLVEFMYLVFTRLPGESYRRRLEFLLLSTCYVFRTLINSLVC